MIIKFRGFEIRYDPNGGVEYIEEASGTLKTNDFDIGCQRATAQIWIISVEAGKKGKSV